MAQDRFKLALPFGFSQPERQVLRLLPRDGSRMPQIVARLDGESSDFLTRALVQFAADATLLAADYISESIKVGDVEGTLLHFETRRVGGNMTLAIGIVGHPREVGVKLPELVDAIFSRLSEEGGERRIMAHVQSISAAAAG